MNEEPKNVIIFGGAFDPPTNGHAQVARFLATRFPDSQIWVMPCSAHTFHKRMADFYHRFALCKIAMLAIPNVVVCDYEHKQKTDGSTYALISSLKAQHPTTNFRVVIGYDNAQDIQKWKNWEKLITETPFIVLSRRGCTIQETEDKWYHHDPHVYIEQKDVMEVSSTKARDVLAGYWVDKNIMGRGAALGKWSSQIMQVIPMHVFLYINDRKLYWRANATHQVPPKNPVVKSETQSKTRPIAAAETV